MGFNHIFQPRQVPNTGRAVFDQPDATGEDTEQDESPERLDEVHVSPGASAPAASTSFPSSAFKRPPAPTSTTPAYQAAPVPAGAAGGDEEDPLGATTPAAPSTTGFPRHAFRPVNDYAALARVNPALGEVFAPEIAHQREQESLAEQAQAARDKAAAAVEKANRNATNDAFLAKAIPTGQRHYRDSAGRLQPVIDADTGKPLYTPHTGSVQYGEDGNPFQDSRDEFGQVKRTNPDADAPIGPNTADPRDPQLYRQTKHTPWQPVGHVDDLVTDGTPEVQAVASQWQKQRGRLIRQSAYQTAQGQVANAEAAHIGAQNRLDDLTKQIDGLKGSYGEDGAPLDDAARDAVASHQSPVGGMFGFGAHPSDETVAAQARVADRQKQIDELTKRQSALQAQLGDNDNLGPLPRALAAAKADSALTLHLLQANNVRNAADERRAVLVQEGKSESAIANDPMLQTILERQQELGIKTTATQQRRDDMLTQARDAGHDLTPHFTPSPGTSPTPTPAEAAANSSATADPSSPRALTGPSTPTATATDGSASPATAGAQADKTPGLLLGHVAAMTPSAPGVVGGAQPFAPTDKPYRVDGEGNLSLDPMRMAQGLALARQAKLIDQEKFKALLPKAVAAQEAAREQQALIDEHIAKEKSAGSYAPGKAALVGAAEGTGFLAASIPGAVVGAEGGAYLAPWTFGASIPVGGILGGLVSGSLGSWGVHKLANKLAEHSDTIKSFTDASDLHPFYNAGGNLVAVAGGLPKVATTAAARGLEAAGMPTFAQAAGKGSGSLVDTVGKIRAQSAIQAAGGAGAAQIVGKVAGQVGKAVGANIAIDTAMKEGGRMLGLSDEHQTWGGAAQAAAVGAFLAGHGIEVGKYSPRQVGDILVKGKAAQDAGQDVAKVLTSAEAEVFEKAQDALDEHLQKFGPANRKLQVVADQATERGQPQGMAAARVIGADPAADGGSSSTSPQPLTSGPAPAPVPPVAPESSGAPYGAATSPTPTRSASEPASSGRTPSAGSTEPSGPGQAPAALAALPPERVAANFAARHPDAPVLAPAVVARSHDYVPPGQEGTVEPQAQADARLAATQQIAALPDTPTPTNGDGKPTGPTDPARDRETASALFKLAHGFTPDQLTAAEAARLKPAKNAPALVRKANGQTILTDAGRKALTDAAPAAAPFVPTTEAQDLRRLSQPKVAEPSPEPASQSAPAAAEPAESNGRPAPTFAASADDFMDGHGTAIHFPPGKLIPHAVRDGSPSVSLPDGSRVFYDPETHTPGDFGPDATPDTPPGESGASRDTSSDLRGTPAEPPAPLQSTSQKDASRPLAAGDVVQLRDGGKKFTVVDAGNGDEPVIRVRTERGTEHGMNRAQALEHRIERGGPDAKTPVPATDASPRATEPTTGAGRSAQRIIGVLTERQAANNGFLSPNDTEALRNAHANLDRALNRQVLGDHPQPTGEAGRQALAAAQRYEEAHALGADLTAGEHAAWKNHLAVLENDFTRQRRALERQRDTAEPETPLPTPEEDAAAIHSALDSNHPVNADDADAHGIIPPAHYERQGDRYVASDEPLPVSDRAQGAAKAIETLRRFQREGKTLNASQHGMAKHLREAIAEERAKDARAAEQAAAPSDPETEDRARREWEAEALRQAHEGMEGSGGVELLDAIKEAGGLPTDDPVFRGELARIRQGSQAAHLAGHKGTFNVFRRTAPKLDELVNRLREMGFEHETPGDLLDAVERRVVSRQPRYGFPARAEAESGMANAYYRRQATPEQLQAATRKWNGFLQRIAPKTALRLQVIRKGTLAELYQGQGRVPDDVQAVYLDRSIYLVHEALATNPDRVSVVNLLHEAAHGYERTLPEGERSALRAQWQNEMRTGESPLHDQEARQAGSVDPRAFDTSKPENFSEWFAERVAHDNAEWAQGRAADKGPIGRFADRFRLFLNRMFIAIRASGSEASMATKNAQFRDWLSRGAPEEISGGLDGHEAQSAIRDWFRKSRAENAEDDGRTPTSEVSSGREDVASQAGLDPVTGTRSWLADLPKNDGGSGGAVDAVSPPDGRNPGAPGLEGSARSDAGERAGAAAGGGREQQQRVAQAARSRGLAVKSFVAHAADSALDVGSFGQRGDGVPAPDVAAGASKLLRLTEDQARQEGYSPGQVEALRQIREQIPLLPRERLLQHIDAEHAANWHRDDESYATSEGGKAHVEHNLKTRTLQQLFGHIQGDFRDHLAGVAARQKAGGIQPRLELVGVGNEGAAFRDRQSGLIYKFHPGTEAASAYGITRIESQPDGTTKVGVEKVPLTDAIARYERQNLVSVAIPTEVAGVTPEGILVTKQHEMATEPKTSFPEIEQMMTGAGAVRLRESNAAANRAQSWAVPDGAGNWMVAADLKPDNVLRDRATGEPKLTDGILAPITPEGLRDNPQLADYPATQPEAQFARRKVRDIGTGDLFADRSPEDGDWRAFPSESGTLGIPRSEMPQIRAEHRGALAGFARGRGIGVRNEEVLPGTLRPSQAEYSPAKIEMARHHEGPDRAVLVSADNHVIDGHHEYLRRVLDRPDEPMKVLRLDAPARYILSQIHEFPSAGMAGPPRLRAGERQGDLLANQPEDLHLVGERAIDHDARQAAQDQALRESEAATARQNTAQLDFTTVAAPADATVPVPPAPTFVAAKSPNGITDFGEKIEGARKDRWGKFGRALQDGLPADVKEITLSKHFPEPDYERLLADGVPERDLATMKALRDMIPSKPQASYKLSRWGELVKGMHEAMKQLVAPDGAVTSQRIDGILANSRQLAYKVSLYRDLGFPAFTQAKDWTMRDGSFDTFMGKRYSPPKTIAYAENKGRMQTDISSEAPTAAERTAEIAAKIKARIDATAYQPPAARETQFAVYQDRYSNEHFIGKKGLNGVVRIKTGFQNAKEALDYRDSNKTELAAKWEEMKQPPNLRRAANNPREGVARHEGDVAPEQFQDAFGFRGVQFGNYVEGPRRQADLNEAFDALTDLAETLGIPTKALSLDGSLGLAFGARGGGSAKAHYEPGQVVINLTKTSGPGSLAHEWFHALDNYFARLDRTGSTSPFPVDAYGTRESTLPANMRPEVWRAFKGIRDMVGKGDFSRRSGALDATRSKPYHGTTIEKAARAFETYVEERLVKTGISNDYLVNIDKAGSDAYPTGPELDGGIRGAYDHLFNTLDTKETEKGIALFARRTLAEQGYRPATDEQRKSLSIPPGWTEVHVATDPNARRVAVGKDAKGRTQSRYSVAHTSAAQVAKFNRGRAFNAALPRILARVRESLASGTGREEAAVLRLIHQTGFRNGGDEGTGQVKAYGASNLRAEHVSFDGDTTHFDFTGKLGVRQQHSVTDPELTADLRERAAKEGALFNTTSGKVLDYLKSTSPFKVHDFRTHAASDLAAREVAAAPHPRTAEEFWNQRDRIGDLAAKKLGDTRKIALESYVDPVVFEPWKTQLGITDENRPSRRASARNSEAGEPAPVQREGAAAADGRPLRDEQLPQRPAAGDEGTALRAAGGIEPQAARRSSAQDDDAPQEGPASSAPATIDRAPISPRDAIVTAKAHIAANDALLKRLGVQEHRFTTTKAESGLEIGEDGILRISAPKLAASMEAVRAITDAKGLPGTPEEWFARALLHEGIHAADASVAREQGMTWKQRYDALPDEAMPSGWSEAGRKAQGPVQWDALEPWQRKSEFSRMVLEGRWQGKITEQVYRVLRQTVDYLKRVAGGASTDPRFQQHVAEIEARLEAARSADDAGTLPDSLPPENEPQARRGGLAQTATAVANEWNAREARDRISKGIDAADTIAGTTGHQAGNDVRGDFGTKEELADPKSRANRDLSAMPFVVEAHGDPRALAADLAKVRAGKDPALAKEFAPLIQHAIDHFTRLDGMKGKYEGIAARQTAIERRHGIDSARYQGDVMRRLELPGAERALEPILLGKGPRYTTSGEQFAKLSDAIAAGYKPTSTNLADLLAHRVAAGQRMVQSRKLYAELKTAKVPGDKAGRPIIADPQPVTLPNGKTEMRPPTGYEQVDAAGVPLTVHKQFAGLFRDFYSESAMRENGVSRGILQAVSFAKHGTLVGDYFHAARMTFKQATGGGGVGYTKGLALLEHNDADLARMVASGDVSQAHVDWIAAHRPAANELLKAGLNVGKFSDNLMDQFHSLAEHIPGVKWTNDWIFQRLSRGAMLQTALVNFERNLARFPTSGREGAARRTATEMNALFGNLGRQGVLKSKTAQDIARCLFLAPQWVESQVRSEVASYVQLGKTIPDALRGRLRVGTLGQQMATGALASFAVAQVINFATRGKPTWENEEEGHKLDAWIPGGTRGFFLPSLGMVAEYGHSLLHLHDQGKGPVESLVHIAQNKLSPVARGLTEAITNHDMSGHRFPDTASRVRASIMDSLPSPMPLSGLIEKDPRGVAGSGPVDSVRSAADKALSPVGYRVNRQPGSLERQLVTAGGMKMDAAPSAMSQMFALAKPFRANADFHSDAPSKYLQLRRAIDDQDDAGAKDEIRALLDTHAMDLDAIGKKVFGIQQNGQVLPPHFTGSGKGEQRLLQSLTPAQRKLYAQAQAENRLHAAKFRQLAALLRAEQNGGQRRAPQLVH